MDATRSRLAIFVAVAVLQGCAGYGMYDPPPPPQPTVLDRGGVRVYVNQGPPASCTRLGTASLTSYGMTPQQPMTQTTVAYYADMAAAQIKAKGGNAGSLNLKFMQVQQISAPTYGLWPAGDVIVYRC